MKLKVIPLFSAVGVAFFAFIAATYLLGGWILMLLLGALHHSVWAAVPAFGFWPSVLIYFALVFVTGLFKGNK